MPSNIFYAEEGSITIGGTDYTGEVKDISVTGGTRGMNQIRTFGNNAYADEQPADPFEVSFTVVAQDEIFWQQWLGGVATGAAPGSAYETTPRTRRDLIINLYDLTNSDGPQLQITAFSAYTTGGDFSLNATDHGEQSPTFTCLTKDFRVRYTPTRTGSVLT